MAEEPTTETAVEDEGFDPAAYGLAEEGGVPEGKSPEEIKGRERLERFGDIVVKVDAVLGRVTMPIEQFLKLGRGAILELEQTKEDDVDICVNGTIVAKGEIVVLDETIGITVKDIAHKNNMYEFDAG